MTTTNADILIIGGGLYGCSTAYHLARNGARNFVVLERKAVSSGGTAKSCAIGRTHYSIDTNMQHAVESLKVLADFDHLVGGHVGWRRTGYLIVGPAEHATPMRNVFKAQKSYGLDAELRDRLLEDMGAILRARGTTVVHVTHDHNEAARLSDRLVDVRTLGQSGVQLQ